MPDDMNLLLSNVWDFILDAVFLVDRAGRIVNVNTACEAILGYRPDEMIGRPLACFQSPDDRRRTEAEVDRVLAGEQRVGFENCYLHKDGHSVHLMWSARWLPELGVRIGVARDVSHRRRAELRNDAGHAILEAAQAALDLPDLCARIHRILAPLAPVALFAVVAASGAGAAELLYADGAFVAGESPCRWYLEHGDADKTIPATALPFPEQNRVRGMLFVRPPAPHVYSAEELELLRLVARFAALALERVQLHLDLLYAAQYDELTRLPNRRLFQDRLATALNRCRRSDIHLGLLFVDVDNFKAVNDTFGHAVGDALLQEIARRLAQCARASDTVARLSGDEFVLIIEELPTPEDAQVVAGKINQAMQLPMDLGGTTLEVGLSLGLAVYPSDTQDADELLSLADAAMYAAKLAKKLKLPVLTLTT